LQKGPVVANGEDRGQAADENSDPLACRKVPLPLELLQGTPKCHSSDGELLCQVVLARQLASRREEARFDQAEDVVVDLLPDRHIVARPEDDVLEPRQQVDALVWALVLARFHARPPAEAMPGA